MNVYYNPSTMTHPGTTLSNVHKADIQDKMTAFKLRIRTPYATREEALSEDSTCSIYFYEDGVLYEAYRTGSWQYKPCTDVACNAGINWNDYYATTIERLREYLTERYGTLLNFAPTLNKYDLYTIQVHYDGRCR